MTLQSPQINPYSIFSLHYTSIEYNIFKLNFVNVLECIVLVLFLWAFNFDYKITEENISINKFLFFLLVKTFDIKCEASIELLWSSKKWKKNYLKRMQRKNNNQSCGSKYVE